MSGWKAVRGCTVITITKSVLGLAMFLLLAFSTNTALASTGLKADFSYVQKGTTLYFSDNSTGSVNIVDHYWDFGDGNQSTEVNPVHAFPGYGQYRIYYRVTTSTGEVAEKSKTITISEQPAIIPVSYAFYGAICVIVLGMIGVVISRRDTGRVMSAIIVFVGIVFLIYGRGVS